MLSLSMNTTSKGLMVLWVRVGQQKLYCACPYFTLLLETSASKASRPALTLHLTLNF